MNFNFGKNNLFKQNFLNSKENKELDDKLDNIYESIQNIVFNESKINKLKSNNINMNIEPNDLSLQNEENIYKINKDFNDEEFIKSKKDNKINNLYNNKNYEKNHINNNNFIQLKFRNFLEQNKKNINDNLAKKDNIIGDNFSFRNNANINRT